MFTNANTFTRPSKRLLWQCSFCSQNAKPDNSGRRRLRYPAVVSAWMRCCGSLAVFAFVALYLCGTACNAQCNANAAQPITVDDETGTIPSSRQLVNGVGTIINTSTPGQISINTSTLPSTKRFGTWTPILTTSTTFTATNITAPTVESAGTVANNSGPSGILIKYPTKTTSGNASGVISTAFTDTEYQMAPVYSCRIQTGSSLTSQRLWVGLTHAALTASATPLNCAAFRFDTSAGDTAWQCCTANSSATVTPSGVTVAASTTYDLVIDMSNSSQILFYINGILVATATATLPTASETLGPEMTLTTLSTTAVNFSVGTMGLTAY